MKKLFAVLLAAVLLLTGAVFAQAEEEKVLNVFTWEGYLDEVTLAGFTEATGIQVNISVFDSNDAMLMKLQSNGGSDYDIVIASDYVLSAARKEGLLLALDREKLTNWDNLNPQYLNQYFDPDNVYSVPYTVGSPMIVYDPEQVEGEITSFSDLWDPQFEDSLWLLDDARVQLGAVLRSLGYSYNTTDEAQLQEAAEKLNAIKPNVRVLNYDMSYDYFAAGEVKAAYMFTPFVYLTMLDNPNLVAVFPEEGIGFGIDSMVIPVNAPHPENAHAFLNYYLQAEVAKTVAESQFYITPNQAAEALLDPEYLACAPFNIPEDLLATKEYVEDIGEAESLYQDIWTDFVLLQ